MLSSLRRSTTLCFGAILTIAFLLPAGEAQAEAGLKFMGLKSCSTSDCHGAKEEKLEGRTIHNEFTTWIGKDKHAQSYSNLTNKQSAEIAKKLGIANAQESERCMNCHSIHEAFKNKDLAGPDFDIADGNSCEDCHGAAEKWLVPHPKDKPENKEWKREQSIAAGMYDTLDFVKRADKCVSCHLSIEHDLMAAGHPKMVFEMDLFQASMPSHWRKEEDFDHSKAWAVGQIISLKAAFKQVADRAEKGAPAELIVEAAGIAQGYALSAQQIAAAIGGDATAIATAMTSVAEGAGAADKAKIAAGNGASGAIDALAAKANGHKFDADTNKKIMAALVAAEEPVTKGGMHTGEQVAMALDSLYRPYMKAANPDKEKKGAVRKALKKMLDLVEKPANWDAAAFTATMKEFAGQL